MELTIEEIKDAFDYIKHVGNGEFEYKHCREGIALDEAVIIMRKYQKIEEIINDRYGKPVFKTLDEVIKVVEGGENEGNE